MKGKKKIPVRSESKDSSDEMRASQSRDADFSQLNGSGSSEEDEEEEEELEEGTEQLSEEEEKSKGIFGSKNKYKQEAREFKEKYLRALADLENFKKRTIKERSELLKYQGQKVFEDILEIVDNLQLALKHAEADPEKLRDGVQLIHKMFVDTLGKWEVRAEPGVGNTFDPNKHAAISRVPTDDAEPGTILDELKTTYFYRDRLLRAGEVVVAAALEVEQESQPSEGEQTPGEPSEEAEMEREEPQEE